MNDPFIEIFEDRIETWDDSMPYRFFSGDEFISDVNSLMEEVLKWHRTTLDEVGETMKSIAKTKPWVMTSTDENERLYPLRMKDIDQVISKAKGQHE